MGLWQKIKSRVSSWIRGGSSPRKSSSASSGTPRAVGSRYRSSGRADRSYNVQRGRAAGLRSVQSAQERKRKEQTELRKKAFEVKKGNYKSLSDSMKDSDSKSELRRLLWSKTSLPTHEERRRSNPSAKYKGGDLKERAKTRQNVSKYNPKATGYLGGTAEGLASAFTFGGTDVAKSRLAKKDKSKVAKRKDGLDFSGANYEKYADKKARKVGKVSGELAGSLLMFGGAGKAAEGTVAKGLSTKAGTKAVEKVAKSKLVRKSAEKAVKKGIRKGTIKAGSEELVKEIAKDKSKRLIKNLAENAIVDSTAGALYDFNRATAQHKIGSKEWKKEMRDNALINVGAAGVGVGLTNLKRNKKVIGEALDNLAKRDDSAGKIIRSLSKSEKNEIKKGTKEEAKNRLAKLIRRNSVGGTSNNRLAPRIGESLDDRIARIDAERLRKGTDAATDSTKITSGNVKKAAPNVKNTAEDVKKSAVLEPEGEYFRGSDDVRQANDITPVSEVRSGRTGERTEFRRSDEETAREQARNRRAENNRQSASQESFDRDFAAFEERARESQARAEEVRSRIRASSSAEEKAALREELDAINAEIGREYRRASMRYHPDRGGSDEWMGRFNEAYDGYKRGAYKSRGFRGATSSTRTRAYSGGGGNTPPPRRGFTASGSDGFKRPKGKAASSRTVYRTEDMVGKSRQKTTMRDRIKELKGSVRTKFADSLAAFEDEARKKTGTERLDDYGAINKVRSYKSQANRSISNQQLKWDGTRYEDGKSVAELFGGMTDEEEKAFNAYLLLKHAPDRLREGKSIFKGVDLADGRTLDDLETINAEIERIVREHPNINFEERANDVYNYTRNELQNRVDAGLLPQSVADDWNKKYPFYVPTGREGYFNGVHGDFTSVTGAGELHAAKGSDYDIWDIKQQLADATTRNWRDMSMNNMFRRMFGDKVANNLAGEIDGGFEKVLDNTISLSKSRERGKYYANVFIDGEQKRVEIDKRFYDAIEDMYKNGRLGNGIDVVNDSLSKVANVWKSLITEWSPIFMIKNFMRDFPEAIINTRQTKEFLQSMGPALNDLLNNGEYSKALRDAGISQSTFIDLDKALAKDKRGIMGLLEKGNELTEMYPRLVEYMATFKKAGVDLKDADMVLRDRAAANAADVTVNFGRSGSVGKMLNRGFVPFFNPSAQGWSKFVRNVTELEGTKEALTFFAKATALGAAPLVVSNFLYKDNPNYQMISARDKANNYIIAIPPTSKDTNMFIKIPRSRFASVYGLPLTNAFNENKMGWAEAIQIANDQVAPIDPLESTLFSPFIAAQNNKTWYGTPIVPGALEDLPKPEQYDANTSLLAKGLGKATEKLPKPLQISPKKADYILDAETGVVGDFVLPALTPSRQGGGKNPISKAAYAMANVPKRQFTIDAVTQNNLSSRFYEKLQEANTNNKSVHGGKKEEEEYKRLNAYSTEISGITKAITDLQNGSRKTKQDDIYGLQKVRNQIMQDALDGKPAPTSGQKLDAVQKYVGTTYAVNNFGSSADKEAMKVYGAAKYGNMTESAMQKRIDADKDFYRGVRAIGKLEDSIAKAGISGAPTNLARSVALASVGADDTLFGAYQGTKKSRTETDTKMNRARNYMNSGGSMKEYVKLEKARKTLGKLSDFDKESELDNALKQLKSGEISESEYYQKQGEIKYNANISYVGLATSFAQANAPSRAYALYDIKSKNVQKGINLAAMGFTARDYRKMAKAVDSNGNGYPSKAEITAYVANSDVEDKATLFDALYYYKGSRNPFGTPTNYSRGQAAKVGKSNGVEAISGETGKIKLKDDGSLSNSGGGYRGYGRRRYGRYRRRGGGGGGGSTKTPAIKESAFKAKKESYKSLAESLKVNSPTQKITKSTVKITPPKVKFKKYEV